MIQHIGGKATQQEVFYPFAAVREQDNQVSVTIFCVINDPFGGRFVAASDNIVECHTFAEGQFFNSGPICLRVAVI